MRKIVIVTPEDVDAFVKSPNKGYALDMTLWRHVATMTLRPDDDFAVKIEPGEAAQFTESYYEWRTPDSLFKVVRRGTSRYAIKGRLLRCPSDFRSQRKARERQWEPAAWALLLRHYGSFVAYVHQPFDDVPKAQRMGRALALEREMYVRYGRALMNRGPK